MTQPNIKNKLRSPIAVTLLIIAAIAIGYFTYRQLSGVAPEQQYRLQPVELGNISQTVSANGTVNPVSLVSIGTQVSGRVKKLYVDFNSKVAKGQVLLELDDALLAAQLKQSQANQHSAAASLELTSANEARMRSLFTQEYISRQELDTAVQARKVAEAQLQSARAQVERDMANLAYAVVRSPVAGVVVDRQVEVGQTVASSFQTPTLFKIAQDLSKMQIDASFAEADIGSIRVGQTVRFNVDAFADRSFQGKVKQVRLNPTTQQNVVTYNVVLNVENPEQILLPGMTAYVSITVAERKEVLLVPNAALRYKPADAATVMRNDAKNNAGEKSAKKKSGGLSGTIYVLQEGKFNPINVTLGITDNRNTEIVAGELKMGDSVVIGDTQPAGNAPTSGSSPMRLRMF